MTIITYQQNLNGSRWLYDLCFHIMKDLTSRPLEIMFVKKICFDILPLRALFDLFFMYGHTSGALLEFSIMSTKWTTPSLQMKSSSVRSRTERPGEGKRKNAFFS